MPRPRKCRNVCCMPSVQAFTPYPHIDDAGETVVMTVEEYETIRLIDLLDFSQEECSVYMKIARATVQQIYANARRKIAQALVEGHMLKIEGGDYRLCDGNECHPACCGCHRQNAAKRCDPKEESPLTP